MSLIHLSLLLQSCLHLGAPPPFLLKLPPSVQPRPNQATNQHVGWNKLMPRIQKATIAAAAAAAVAVVVAAAGRLFRRRERREENLMMLAVHLQIFPMPDDFQVLSLLGLSVCLLLSTRTLLVLFKQHFLLLISSPSFPFPISSNHFAKNGSCQGLHGCLKWRVNAAGERRIEFLFPVAKWMTN